MSLEQDVGLLQGQVGALQSTTSDIKTSLTELETKFDAHAKEVSDYISQGKGGWKLVTLAVASVAGISSAVHWIISHIKLG